ncbi:protein transporter tim10 [Puccinia graminis f. sp. tritici]|nr:protein transporter tim10 [Puccinia graminis f. sp. tritici]
MSRAGAPGTLAPDDHEGAALPTYTNSSSRSDRHTQTLSRRRCFQSTLSLFNNMSIFGRSSSSAPAPSAPSNIDAAATELEMVSDLFNRLVRSCHGKCIGNRYLEADLTKGESTCIDRCVDKFFNVNTKVGERIQAKGAASQLSQS